MMLAVVCLVLLVYGLWKIKARRPEGVPPHSGYEFFFGVTRHEGKAVFKDKVAVSMYNYNEMKRNGFQAYGWGHIGGGRKGIVICDPNDVKHMLKGNFSNYEKAPGLIEIFQQLLGQGIFNTNGAVWKEQRTIASHMFSRRQLRDRMSTVFGAHSLELATALEAEVGTAVNIQPFFYNFTFDTINMIAFSRDVNALQGNAKDRKFQEAFDILQSKIVGRFLIPWWKINRRFQLTESERAMKNSMEIITAYITEVVDTYYDDAGRPKEDVLENDQTLTGLFLTSAVAEGRSTSKEYLKDMIMNFVIAGRDTTGSALTSCVELLCGEEEWQAKLHEEAVKCFNGNLETPLTLDDLEDCEVSKAIFMETLRLHPSVPINEKVALDDDTLPSGVKVTAGDHLAWLTVATNTNPAFWGPTADKFDPTRWMRPKSELPDEYHYPTFNAGPRLCLGREMAILEGQTALLTIFSRLKFSKVDGIEPKLISSVTWQLDSDGLQVNVGKW